MLKRVQKIELISEINGHLPFEFSKIEWSKIYPDKIPPNLSCEDELFSNDEFDTFYDYFEENNLAQKGFHLWDFCKNLDVLEITTEDSLIQTITAKDIASRMNGVNLDHVSFEAKANYVCCILDYAIGQAGALGIWDVSKSDWCFWHSDELFCVDKIDYYESEDLFLGTCEFSYPMSPLGGKVRFEISPTRELKIKDYDYVDGDGNKQIGIGQVFGW